MTDDATTYVLIDCGDVVAVVTVAGKPEKRATKAMRHFAKMCGVSAWKFAKSGADVHALAGTVPQIA